MDDLISRQAAIDALNNADVVVMYHEDDKVDDVVEEAILAAKHSAEKSIEALPSAQPAILSTPSYTISLGEPAEYVPIIRCKDCEWFGDIGCAIRIVDDSDKPTENDFCSFAERRTDEADD